MKRFIKYILLLIAFASCNTGNKKNYEPGTDKIAAVVNSMSDIMVHDVTNPPLAARFFAYSFLAGYEVVSENDSSFKTMHGLLNRYPQIKKPAIENYNYQLASVYAVLETAGKLQPSGKLLDSIKQIVIDSAAAYGVSKEIINASKEYGEYVSKEILKYAKADGYRNISDYPRYTPRQGDGYWFPTPPAFMGAVEPYFNTVRPFMLDSAAQFKPVAPVVFNSKKGTAFYALMDSVYQTGVHLTGEQKTIASFWDCNPFAMEDEGHLRVGIKKISPDAHWMGIAGIACNKTNASFNKAMQVHMLTAITLMDAFICCWDEKFRSNRIRPETAIRKYIDASWMPLLQTPPFPEYLSGHSVISSASSEVLSYFFGDTFTYTDDVESAYGLPPRTFTSFRQAAAEAGISRYYGGIHFQDAVNEGMKQGKNVGGFIIDKMFNSNK